MTFWRIIAIGFFLNHGSLHTFANIVNGNESGNGGDVLKCTDISGKNTYQILDIYEATEFYNLTPDYGPTGLSYMEHAEYVLN